MSDKRAFKLEVKELNEQGVFEGYASVFGNEDFQGEVVEKGAFKRTLNHNKGKVPVLWQHNPSEPIGLGMEMSEDDRGLKVKAQINLETQRGREAYSLLRQGALKGLSIGYDVVKDKVQDGTRRLKELRLWEYSLVTFPANAAAQVATVKETGKIKDEGLEPESVELSSMEEKTVRETISLLEALLTRQADQQDPGKSDSSDLPADAGPGTATETQDEDVHSLVQLVQEIRDEAMSSGAE